MDEVKTASYVSTLLGPAIVAFIAGLLPVIGIYLKVRGEKDTAADQLGIADGVEFRRDLLARLKTVEDSEKECWKRNADLTDRVHKQELEVVKLKTQVEALKGRREI